MINMFPGMIGIPGMNPANYNPMSSINKLGTRVTTNYATYANARVDKLPFFIFGAYIVYFIVLGSSLYFTVKLVSIQKGLMATQGTEIPIVSSSTMKLAEDLGEILGSIYTILGFGIIFYIAITLKFPNLGEMSPTILAFITFVNFVFQIVSFAPLNQSPKFEAARQQMGTMNLNLLRAFSGIGIIISFLLFVMNVLEISRKNAAAAAAAAGSVNVDNPLITPGADPNGSPIATTV